MLESNLTYTYPLLESKLAVPPVSVKLVSRSRLFDCLQESLDKRLTIVVSPAGYGKSSLVSSWCQRLQSKGQTGATEESIDRIEVAVGWLSLDELDNDPVRFWHYFVSAWCRALNSSAHAAPLELEQEVSRLIHTYSPIPVDAILTLLLNELAKAVSFSRELVLVLDDYHLITDGQIHKGLGLFVERLPPGVHLVLATRTDPDLPLSRYRTRGWLVEIRAEDLLFSQAETNTFFEQSMHLTLSEKEVAQLTGRTEGWAAGLQLAGLALQSQKKAGKDTSRFIEDFAGSHRFVLDYLSDEVLENQPDEIRDFLLRISILEKFSRALCEAVTANANARNLLNRLEEANLFIIPLDEKRQWYRYHHLFAEVLQAHLMETMPDEISSLHLKAAEWFATQEMSDEAVGHALASQDFEFAAQLVARYAEQVWLRREFITLHNWFGLLPEEALQNYPKLSILKARFLILMGDIPGAEKATLNAKSGLENQNQTNQSATGQGHERKDYARLNGEVAALQGMFQVLRGNFTQAKELGEYAASLLPASEALALLVPLNLGATYWMSGDSPRALQILEQAHQDYLASNNFYLSRIAVAYLAGLRIEQTELDEAEKGYQELLKRDQQSPLQAAPQTPRPDQDGFFVGLGVILYHRGRLAEAESRLRQGVELARTDKNNVVLVTGLLWLARLYLAKKGKDEETKTDLIRQMVEEAETRATALGLNWLWLVPSVPAFLSELYLSLGEVERTRYWLSHFKGTVPAPAGTIAGPSNESADGVELSAVVEAENLAAVWVHLWQGQLAQVLEEIPKLKAAATHTNRKRSLIELLVMEATTLNRLGQTEDAISKLQEALELAVPQQVSYIFIEKADRLGNLLSQTLARPQARTLDPHFVQPLLTIIKAEGFSQTTLPAGTTGEAKPSSVPQDGYNKSRLVAVAKANTELIEPLSERELAVLQLIGQGVSNQEIAERLIIAMPTVKKHIGNIFAKLEVTNRVQAILRAKELGLIS